MLSRRLAGVALAITVAVSPLVVAPAASAAPPTPPQQGGSNPPRPPQQGGGNGGQDTSGDAGDGEISAGAQTTATIETSGTTTSGTPFTTRVSAPVPRRCWYGPGMSGYAYYEYWKPGGEARKSPTLDQFAAQGLLHPKWDDPEIAADTEGRWYSAECAYGIDGDEWLEYHQSHPPVYVFPGDPAPPVEESVDPRVLAEIAVEHMQLPEGRIAWNPSLDGSGATVINMATFVWVENTTTSVSVTASVPGVWSRVEANMTQLQLSSEGYATPSTCIGTAGTPYTPGMTDSDCKIEFYRSSAGAQPKGSGSLPTATLTARAIWEASWTSSLDPTPQALEVQPVTVTAEVPVAEIQTIVTR